MAITLLSMEGQRALGICYINIRAVNRLKYLIVINRMIVNSRLIAIKGVRTLGKARPCAHAVVPAILRDEISAFLREKVAKGSAMLLGWQKGSVHLQFSNYGIGPRVKQKIRAALIAR